jgi:hypothetical protein
MAFNDGLMVHRHASALLKKEGRQKPTNQQRAKTHTHSRSRRYDQRHILESLLSYKIYSITYNFNPKE